MDFDTQILNGFQTSSYREYIFTITMKVSLYKVLCLYNMYSNVNLIHSDHAVIIERPRLTSGPSNVIGVTEHESIHFECHFNSSLIQYLAICEWLKDGDPAVNGNKWQTTEPGFENHLICGFNINSASFADEGNYSCYCYYNESFREQLHIPKQDEIRSQFGNAVLQLEISKITNYYS